MTRARLQLAGRAALVTGAGGGIGAALSARLAARGASVVLCDLDGRALDRAAAALPERRALAVAADVTDARAMRRAVDAAVGRFGRLDVVVANAGVTASPLTTALTMDAEQFERVVAVDLLGVWRTVKPALPHVVAARGHVLLTGSLYCFVNGAVNAPYAVSKAGVEQLGRALRTELAPHGATAGVLYPAWIATDLARPGFGGDPLVTRLRERTFRGPLGAIIGPERLAAAAVRGIEARSARVFAPRGWAAYSALRGLLNPLADAAIERDAEISRLLGEVERDRRRAAP